MSNKIKYLFLLALITVNVYGQNKKREYIVELKMDTITNTNIQLRIGYEDKNFDHIVLSIPGKLENNTWKFHIPDSLNNIDYMSLDSPMENDSIEKGIGFAYIAGNDTLPCSSINFEKNHSISVLKFAKSLVHPNILYSDKNTGEAKFKTLYQDIYFIEETNDLQLLSSIEFIEFIRNLYNKKISYEDKFHKYMSLVKEYPNSNSLIVGLASNMTTYKAKEEVAEIYNYFTNESQNSYYGKKIYYYLNQTFFDNIMLPSWDTEISELIIKDHTKYSLVVFSASWCAPCHKMIPVLKQIYNDLQDEIDIVYVSIDEDKSVKFWKELMENEEIPWRSVLAKDQVKSVQNKYAVQGIPCTFLVNPQKEIRRIELRNDEERIELYRLFQK